MEEQSNSEVLEDKLIDELARFIKLVAVDIEAKKKTNNSKTYIAA